MSLTRIGSIGINTGIKFSGLTTITTLNTSIDTLSIGGPVSIAGTLTYEDVTNVDAVGLITARAGVNVGSGITLSKDGDVFFTGIATGNGSGLTNLPAANITGTLPAISGANLTNLDASDLASGTVPTARLGSGTASSSTFLRGDSTFAAANNTTINDNANNRVITGTATADTLQGESTFTYDGSGNIGVTNSSGSVALTITTANNTDGGIYFTDGADGNKGAISYLHTDDSMKLRVNGQTKLNIDSSGNLSQGTTTATTPDGSNADNSNNGLVFTMYGDSPAINLIHNTSGGSADSTDHAAINFGRTGSSSNPYRAIIAYKQDDDFLRINANNYITFESGGDLGSEKMRLDGDGRLLIGTTTEGASEYDDLTIATSGHTGITIRSGTSNEGTLAFSDGTSGSDEYRGLIQYNHSNNYLRLLTDATERMRIDSDGNITAPYQPAFSMYINNNQLSASYNTGMQIMPFGETNTNIGSHFKTSGSDQYKFVAPVAGQYFFALSQNHSSRVDTRILKNGSTFHGGENEIPIDETDGQWHHHTLTCLMTLAAGDKVHCETNNQDGNPYRCWNGNTWDNFSGYLVG